MRSLSVFVLAVLLLFPFGTDAQRRGRKKTKPAQAASPAGKPAGDARAPFKLAVDYKPVGAPMPPIRLTGLNGTVWNNDSLRNGRNSFLMLFNPGCDHCQLLTKAIQKEIKLFRRNSFAMVAGPMMRTEAGEFAKKLEMDRYPQIKLGLDSSDIINNIFLYQSIPQVNIYSPDGRLIRSYSALTTIDSLRQYIEP